MGKSKLRNDIIHRFKTISLEEGIEFRVRIEEIFLILWERYFGEEKGEFLIDILERNPISKEDLTKIIQWARIANLSMKIED